ncbi:MAG: signal peptidase I [Clostridia bacterium]|nr:signal peptidase I [Deltaproteobacteria bacterium]
MATRAVDTDALALKTTWRESTKQIVGAILVALLLRSFVVEAFKIPSGSMIPTLHIGDQIFVNKFIYGPRIPFTEIRIMEWAQPKRGEVIVFVIPTESHEDLIKRVIGVPGDTIQVRDGTLLLNGSAVQDEVLGKSTEWDRKLETGIWSQQHSTAITERLDDKTFTVLDDGETRGDSMGPFTVKPGHVFVMGDNRDRSYDSRFWGQVPMQNVLGRAMFVWWSWGKEGFDAKRLGTWIN